MKVYAEEVNFWKTGREAPDKWLERTRRQILLLGGQVISEGFGDTQGQSAFLLVFTIEGDNFKVVWPVLPSKTGNVGAARRQAATMLYHYVKSVCLYAVIVGPRAAFFSHLLLEDGRTAAQASNIELESGLLLLPSTHGS